MNKEDYYQTLGISKGASEKEIKSAYRKMAKQYHPDANPGDAAAEAKFKQISEANEILSDPQKKAAYDQYGHAAFQQGAGGGGGGFGGFGGFGGGGMDMDDILSSFFGGGGFNQSRTRRNGPMRGSDLQTHIRITFEEAYFGVKKEITLPILEQCSPCKGTGAKPGTTPENCRNCGGGGQEYVEQQTMFGTMRTARPCRVCRGEGKIVKDPCTTCKGQGRVKRSNTLEVNIPRGIDTGQSIRLSERGEAGERGGRNGDLLIGITVNEHDHFKRKGSNIYLDIPVSFTQAALGAELTIPTMEGTEKFDLKAGTQPETIATLKGKGFPSVKNSKVFGDMVFTLKVQVPTSLTETQRELLQAFAGETGDDVKSGKQGFKDKIKNKFKN